MGIPHTDEAIRDRVAASGAGGQGPIFHDVLRELTAAERATITGVPENVTVRKIEKHPGPRAECLFPECRTPHTDPVETCPACHAGGLNPHPQPLSCCGSTEGHLPTCETRR